MLKRHGWSWQQPARRAIERDDEAVELPGHIHFIVQPAGTEDMARFDAFGPALQVAMGEARCFPPAVEVERV
ncbi:winged helix-turn-helix domain-containing protein [Streptomyces sp. NPDC001714]|uniref:helix-turn-helix domain-containing protein n=1 Tax=Streptomyces sp. NPDC001714 TaxID=3364603 RepID=UPI0036BB2600